VLHLGVSQNQSVRLGLWLGLGFIFYV